LVAQTDLASLLRSPGPESWGQLTFQEGLRGLSAATESDPKLTLMPSGAAARRCARLANNGERFANHRLDGLDDEPRCGACRW